MGLHNQLSAEGLAERIVDGILEEKILNKQSLLPKVTAYIKAFYGKMVVPKDYNAYINPNDFAKLRRVLEKRDCESKFWLDVVRSVHKEEEMKVLYARQVDHLKENGFFV